MKFWTSGILIALGAFLPSSVLGQGPSDAGFYSPSHGLPSFGGPEPGVYDQLLPANRLGKDYYEQRNFPLAEAAVNSFIRLDYMHWNISGGDGALLGAPSSSGADLSGRDRNNRLDAVDPTLGPLPQTSVIVPSLDNEYDTINGLRGLWGLPTNLGTLETEVFYFEQVNNPITINPGIDRSFGGIEQSIIGGTTLFDQGAISSTTMILYNQGYLARQKTSFWGSEINWVFNELTPNAITEIAPIVGFRHMQLNDTLRISGAHSQDEITLNHMISSLARNDIFGPQIGFRLTSHVTSRFELGVETKFLAGINRLHESVGTSEIYNPQVSDAVDPTLETDRNDKDTRTKFAPVFDLALTGKYHVSPHFKLFASYELLLGAGFSRSFNNVLYDSPATTNSAPTIRLKPSTTEFMAHGFAVGGEFSFR